MRNLLIVDDEKNIRLGLKAMIERQFPERYAFRFAENGREALEQLAASPADLMITDIRMPVLDGLGLLERLHALGRGTGGGADRAAAGAQGESGGADRAAAGAQGESGRGDRAVADASEREAAGGSERGAAGSPDPAAQGKLPASPAARPLAGPAPLVIILSGHDDFPYARAAIRYQAKEYLLKPIKREELFEVLERLEGELDRRHGAAAGAAAPADRESRAGELLQGMLTGEAAPEAAALAAAGLGWLAGDYSVGVLRAAGGGEGSQLQGLVQPLLEETGSEAWAMRQLRGGDLVLAAEDEELLRRLGARLDGHALLRCRLALSSRATGPGQLRRAYSQAQQAQKYFLLHPGVALLSYDSVRSLSAGCPLPEEPIRRLSNLLGTGRLPEMKKLLQGILDIRVIGRCEIGYLEGISRRLNEEVFDGVFRSYGEESVDILRLYKSAGHIENFERFEDYYRHVEQLLERLDEFVGRVRGAHADRKDMQKAVEYLQEHYAEDVNMAVVSNHISLNYTYFSQAFKEHTGESFSSYLRKLRLNRAKDLLSSSDLKVYEISAQSGFDNVKHFTRVFKEAEGITPLEFRSMRQGIGPGR
ncbi:helix-turn-helix domain-containing protein [Paenibacillus pasadenensis]|uniref:Two-component response regulator yesN n=1 Tax=Paenibacillus pasadenensis TaxID=217090 RepID=A0A2N5NBL6_9BACL|nr:helix-turn-helix domain-containing protein [Paenibacillus pasadenensis]PLT47741.1 Two-component response regulator yesN [Paenibacillus pasadenensis]